MRQDEGFCEQLVEDPRSAGPERGANRDLSLTRGCARQHQTRDIGAGDQQHQTDGSREDHQR
jgi:hypothetical protein